MTNPLLQVDNLQVTFRTRRGTVPAVDGVSLTIHSGRTLCLVGESGSGKSATALSILGLLEPSAQRKGRILLDGVDLAGLSDQQMTQVRGRRIGMIFQEPTASLNPVLSIGAQVAQAVRWTRHVSSATARREAIDLLAAVRLPNPEQIARQYPHELSGGMNQRVMIAIALAGQPSLLIADEPTTALDVTVQAEILRLLRWIQQQRGLSLLLITHDLGVVAQMADEVAVMYAGQLVEAGPASELIARPKHPYTQSLWQSIPRLDRNERPTPMLGPSPSGSNWPIGCRFRPRCPSAFESCSQDPQVLLRQNNAQPACWLAPPHQG
jgi:peptide/nickel transport system ATP-binding protein/oligopeptide transport system ATP-binding protein